MNKKTLIWVAAAVGAILLYRHYKKSNGTTISTTSEGMSSATGGQCTHPAAPASFADGSFGCDALNDCTSRGGNPVVTNTGGGYRIDCGGRTTTVSTSGGRRTVAKR